MTLTFTDIFCGAGGSSTGLVQAGLELKLAANHSRIAISTHAANHPDADHVCADINNYDMRRRNQQIAEQLGIPLDTLKSRLNRLHRKLGTSGGDNGSTLSRAALVAYAYENGLAVPAGANPAPLPAAPPPPAMPDEIGEQLLTLARMIVRIADGRPGPRRPAAVSLPRSAPLPK